MAFKVASREEAEARSVTNITDSLWLKGSLFGTLCWVPDKPDREVSDPGDVYISLSHTHPLAYQWHPLASWINNQHSYGLPLVMNDFKRKGEK